ncbi:MAG: site-specific tyrosine recombinase XerD, partial [Acidimicrobiales bacterium]
ALSTDCEEYLSYLSVERGRAPASISSYRRDLASYEEFLQARGLGLFEVSPRVVEDYLAFLAASGRRATSNARALSAIRGLHRFCEDERGLGPDPTDGIRGPRLPQPIPKALNEEDIVRLLDSVTGDRPAARRDRAILELMYATGMRISELTGLRLGDIDFDRGLAIVFGKGSKERIVPFGRPAARALSAWLEIGGRPAMAPARWARRSDEEALFISSRGRCMSRQSVWLVVRHAAERAGLSDKVSPHVLRHSCATHLLEHGADIRVVQELLGHAAITTTQVYTKVSGDLLKAAYEQAHPRARRRVAGK